MLNYWLVNIIVIVHFSFVLFVVFGAFLLIWSRKIIWLHLPAAIWGVVVEYCGWICPLTPLENRLRYSAGREIYKGGFIENNIMPILYPDNLTREIQYLLGTCVIIINGILYWYVFVKRKNR
ncbi:DUF2784 domain-containing protein [bacterium]|nr:DUF2784 domain-containing protein [bacterium]